MKTQHEVIEDIQEAFIKAGGRFFRHQEILDMLICTFLEITLPNQIDVSVKYFEEDEADAPKYVF